MKKIIGTLGLVIFIWGCKEKATKVEITNDKYEADWESLSNYKEAADWFKDAKFGIYAHWGVMSVPAFANDWYARNMHIEGSNEYKHHVETYGKPSEFGYHDFVPMFKAENFDAETWADLFKKSGAKFAGLVAEHHDGWSNWGSKINPWNAVDMGPKRDVYGELAKAIHERDMKLVASFHMARNLQIFKEQPQKWLNDTSYFPYNPKMPTSSEDPLFAKMYGNISKDKFSEDWLGQLKEVIDNYSPDLIYFDSQTQKIPESYKKEFAAYYFNDADKKNKEVVFTHKEGEFPKSVSLEDFEKGRMNRITEEFWLTDETVSLGSWSYTENLALKTTAEIIHVLVDVVSKNGALMLNVSPKANGIIPENQQNIILEIGEWLNVNGEAIYETRPWQVFGEGPTKQEKSGMFLDKITYTAQDVRYTKKGNTIYAIVLGWPGEHVPVTLNSFTSDVLGKQVPNVDKLSILGYQQDVVFNQNDTGLHFKTPREIIDNRAFVVKIEIK
ncbi:alpha-L-fucosidase [Aestuariibaculum sp. M13]|uniref:alpha-L-fucosidase n=1 Tax=Aestuariibaculum sp. M13 TaxID=2967132 RepID=UPI002159DAE5|nr:alpha-L-fucosidase [Aestuariibaculum sp. M13]MCR8667999.1 alpha-L-fucosidase [Aestuariibaculum sp. M13]